MLDLWWWLSLLVPPIKGFLFGGLFESTLWWSAFFIISWVLLLLAWLWLLLLWLWPDELLLLLLWLLVTGLWLDVWPLLLRLLEGLLGGGVASCDCGLRSPFKCILEDTLFDIKSGFFSCNGGSFLTTDSESESSFLSTTFPSLKKKNILSLSIW